MFIKPFDCTNSNEPSAWVEHAANTYFRVQSKVSSGGFLKGFLAGSMTSSSNTSPTPSTSSHHRTTATPVSAFPISGQMAHPFSPMQKSSLATSSPEATTKPTKRRYSSAAVQGMATNSAAAERRKLVQQYKFRITLTTSSEQVYIVAVADSLQSIMGDWAWIEVNLNPKIAKFDEVIQEENRYLSNEEMKDLDLPLLDISDIGEYLLAELEKLSLEDETPISEQEELIKEMAFVLQTIFKLENESLLHFFEGNFLSSGNKLLSGFLCLTTNYIIFHDGKLGTAGNVVSKSQTGTEPMPQLLFSIAFKDVTAVDLVRNPRTRLFSESLMISTRDKKYFFSTTTKPVKQAFQTINHLCNVAMKKLVHRTESSNDMGTKDTTSDLGGEHRMQASKMKLRSGMESPIIEDKEKEEMAAWIMERRKTVVLQKNRSANDILASSTVSSTTATPTHYKSLEDVEEVRKNHQFRCLFFLPDTEKLFEIHPCSFSTDIIKATLTGKIYISSRFLSFASYQDHISHPIGTQKLSIQTPLTLVIPITEITALTKQAAPSFLTNPLTSFFNILTSSPYISITVRSGKKFWFCSQKKHSNLYDVIMGLIRNVEFPEANQVSHAIPGIGDSGVSEKNARDMSTLKKTSAVGDNRISAQDPLPIGLRFLFDLPEHLMKNEKREVEIETLWVDYFAVYGRDICMVKNYQLRDLIAKGVSDSFRGQVWMLCSGAIYSKPQGRYYHELLESAAGSNGPTLVRDEIEKDLHRSLPEHPAYHDKVGIDALRRILTAYSYRNPTIGYAQAMNMIGAVLLLFLKEEDAFWLLCTICESFLPEHYSKTLVGSVIDQTVFEHLVRKHLPQLYAHLKELGVELSTITVPWFVSLFLNTLPLMCVLRVLDCFFYEGPRVLFMIGLSILRVNEQALLEVKDDDMIIMVLRSFFNRCNEKCKSDNSEEIPEDTASKEKKTKSGEATILYGQELFDHLIMIGYRSYSFITYDVVEELRNRYRLSVVQTMEDSNKRIQLRLLREVFQGRLSDKELEVIYDAYKDSQFLGNEDNEDNKEEHQLLSKFSKWEEVLGSGEPPEQTDFSRSVTKSIHLRDFRKLLEKISPWNSSSAESVQMEKTEAILSSGEKRGNVANEECIPLLDRVYAYAYYIPPEGIVTISNVVHVLDIICKQSLYSKVHFFFRLHDIDCDGFLDKQELTTAAASLMWLFEGRDNEDSYMHEMSRFLTLSFQSASSLGAGINRKEPSQSPFPSGSTGESGSYRLTFNHFLLVISSLSEFVLFFEKVWEIE